MVVWQAYKLTWRINAKLLSHYCQCSLDEHTFSLSNAWQQLDGPIYHGERSFSETMAYHSLSALAPLLHLRNKKMQCRLITTYRWVITKDWKITIIPPSQIVHNIQVTITANILPMNYRYNYFEVQEWYLHATCNGVHPRSSGKFGSVPFSTISFTLARFPSWQLMMSTTVSGNCSAVS